MHPRIPVERAPHAPRRTTGTGLLRPAGYVFIAVAQAVPADREEPAMLAIIAAILFAIAFIINATGTAVSAVFDPTSLLLIGLALLALHLAGVGSGWRWRR